MKRLIWLLIMLYAILTFAGSLTVDGSFRSAGAGAGIMGLSLLGVDLYAEMIPFRSNRTYYRVVITRLED